MFSAYCVDPNQTRDSAVSDLTLHCLHMSSKRVSCLNKVYKHTNQRKICFRIDNLFIYFLQQNSIDLHTCTRTNKIKAFTMHVHLGFQGTPGHSRCKMLTWAIGNNNTNKRREKILHKSCLNN